MIKMTRKKYNLPNRHNEFVNRVQWRMLEACELFLSCKEEIMAAENLVRLRGFQFHYGMGICNNIARYLRFSGLMGPRPLEISDATIATFVVTWPHYSGCLAHPVEGTGAAYNACQSLWHNPLRWQLVEHLRDELKKIVHEPENKEEPDRSLSRNASFL